jgi:hypothetical protein
MQAVLHLHSLFLPSHMTFSSTPSRLFPSGHLKCRARVSEATPTAYKITTSTDLLAWVLASIASALPVSGCLGRVWLGHIGERPCVVALPHLVRGPATAWDTAVRDRRMCRSQGDQFSPTSVGASQVLPCSGRRTIGHAAHSAGIRPALQGTRGGMGRPVVGREDLQGTETSLGSGVWVATRRL